MEDEALSFDHFGDVELKVCVGIGKCVKTFGDIMRLRAGDVITLDRKKDGLVDLSVNERFFIAGEMVVANDKYSVRIVEFA